MSQAPMDQFHNHLTELEERLGVHWDQHDYGELYQAAIEGGYDAVEQAAGELADTDNDDLGEAPSENGEPPGEETAPQTEPPGIQAFRHDLEQTTSQIERSLGRKLLQRERTAIEDAALDSVHQDPRRRLTPDALNVEQALHQAGVKPQDQWTRDDWTDHMVQRARDMEGEQDIELDLSDDQDRWKQHDQWTKYMTARVQGHEFEDVPE